MGQQDTFAGFCVTKFYENSQLPINVVLIDQNLVKINQFSVSSFRELGNRLYNTYKNSKSNFIFLSNDAEALKTYILEKQEIKQWGLFFRTHPVELPTEVSQEIFEKNNFNIPFLGKLVQDETSPSAEISIPDDPDIILYNGKDPWKKFKQVTNLLLLDTETGGLDSKVFSLLTFYGRIIDFQGNVIDSISLKLKENNGTLHVHQGAIKKNKINLAEHKQMALTYADGRTELTAWLYKHTDKFTKLLIPVAHNLEFDKTWLLEKQIILNWEDYFSRRDSICTMGIASFLKRAGVLDSKNLNLGALAKHFQITADNLHDAQGDVVVMEKIFEHFIHMVKKQEEKNDEIK